MKAFLIEIVFDTIKMIYKLTSKVKFKLFTYVSCTLSWNEYAVYILHMNRKHMKFPSSHKTVMIVMLNTASLWYLQLYFICN